MKKSTEKNQVKAEGIIPKLARKIGQTSVNQTCYYWVHQPVVPASMKKKD